MKKIIVAGGSGFIGSHLCQRLVDDGNYVVALDRKSPEFELRPAHEYHIVDLRNTPDYLVGYMRDVDEIYQLAAEMGGAGYVFTGENDADVMRNSVLINANALEAAHLAGVPRVLFTSSACVYPSLPLAPIASEPDAAPVFAKEACEETDAGRPDSPYGLEKLFSESLYDSYRRNRDVETRIARLHNVFGPYGTWRGGREKAPAAFCRKIAEAPDGGDVACYGNGRQTRSFLYVDEAVEGLTRLMASNFSAPVNVGSSESISIDDMARMIADIAGKQIQLVHEPGPIGVAGRNSDNTRIEQVLGWKPTQSLRAGLEKTYPWIAEQVAKAR